MRFLLDGGLKKVKKPNAFKNFIKRMAANREKKVPIFRADPRDTEAQIFNRQTLLLCEQILASLKSECQEILSIYFRYKALGGKIKDIAKGLKRPQGTVSSLIHRCLKLLNTHPKMRALKKEVLGEVG